MDKMNDCCLFWLFLQTVPDLTATLYSPWSESGTWWSHPPRTSHKLIFYYYFLNAQYNGNDRGALCIKPS